MEGEPATIQRANSEEKTQNTLCTITDSTLLHVNATMATAMLLYKFLKVLTLIVRSEEQV